MPTFCDRCIELRDEVGFCGRCGGRLTSLELEGVIAMEGTDTKQCQHCKKMIMRDAELCCYCKKDLRTSSLVMELFNNIGQAFMALAILALLLAFMAGGGPNRLASILSF